MSLTPPLLSLGTHPFIGLVIYVLIPFYTFLFLVGVLDYLHRNKHATVIAIRVCETPLI